MERKIEPVQFSKISQPKFTRVAAYARVSNGKDAMLHSLSAQVSYYNSLIQNHPDWQFCGVYADEALTGTKENRENFQKMLTDCRDGNLDMILTKSISRFARNTVTLLETVRELKNLGVDVFFEEQNIHTMSADGELMLTILASYAQAESYSASENKKWQIRKDFEQGKIASITMLGYRNCNGNLEIVPQEAKIVKMIFADYLAGMGKQAITNKLNEMGIPTRHGNQWGTSGVLWILQNEKYVGNMLLQKTFRENHITKKKCVNDGQLPQYYVENSHQGIIDKATFDAVQERIRRQKKYATRKSTTVTYPFSGKMQCGGCGKNYRRKTTATGIVWICTTYNSKGKKYCPKSKQVPETTLFSACCEALQFTEFDADVFESKIEKILVPEPNLLVFQFYDGDEEMIKWQDRSRSESWTDEMKQKAREKQCRE